MNLEEKRVKRLKVGGVYIKTKPNQLQSGVFGIKQQSLKRIAFNDLGAILLRHPRACPEDP